jgi:hypothetical protein
MRSKIRLTLSAAFACMLLGIASPAGAVVASEPPPVDTFTFTDNMIPTGFSARANATTPNSDLAFWGDVAVHGNYDGFRLVDISTPSAPVQIIDYRECLGNQGDVLIWDTILIRSWNSPAPAGATVSRSRRASRACTSSTFPTGPILDWSHQCR